MVKKVIKKKITKEIKGAVKSSKKKKSTSKTKPGQMIGTSGVKMSKRKVKGKVGKPKPIQSERSKIAAANAKAASKRAKAAGKTGGVGAAAKTITSRTARARNKTGAAASRPGRGVAATAIGGAAALTLMNKKGSSGAAKVTFAEAFKKARAKGEGTLFTHNGKKYIAVTKTDLKKKGYDAN